MSFQKEVWKNLSAINVNENTEKLDKGKFTLTYLSWTWAWATLMESYPESEFEFHDNKVYPDGSVEVSCTVKIKEGEQECTRLMWLPVMDHKNNSVINPSSRHTSDAKMRCLTKCLALFGLGHYIYAGEDIPSAEKYRKYTDEQMDHVYFLLNANKPAEFRLYLSTLTDEVQTALFNGFESGKTAMKEQWREVEAAGEEHWANLTANVLAAADSEDGFAVYESIFELSKQEQTYLIERLGKDAARVRALYKEVAKAAKSEAA